MVSGRINSSQQTVVTDNQNNYMTSMNKNLKHQTSRKSISPNKFKIDFDSIALQESRIPMMTNGSRIPTIRSSSNFDQYMIDNSNHAQDKTHTSRLDKSDRLQNEMNEYYRSLNLAARKSQKKL